MSRHDRRVWFGAGVGVAAIAALGTTLTPSPAADAALVGAALVGLASGLAAFLRGGWLAALPLEIAPLALGGELDAVPIVRVRARLGLGRPFRAGRARVWVRGDGGEIELPARLPDCALIGPVTIVATDVAGRARAGTDLRVRVEVEAGGRTWTAERVVPAPTAAGRFGGVAVGPRGVELRAGWADPERPGPDPAC